MPKVVLSRKDPRPLEVTPATIVRVEPGSPAERAGVRRGWELLRVNGAAIPDVLAYRRELERGDVVVEVREPSTGRSSTFEVSWEDPGLEFDDVIFDGIRLCANKCDFCYIHQMPKGMRKSLYIMDDDYRTSFLYGSFVTLTNLTEADVQRILDEHLSPLYVSVHSTDEVTRDALMKPWPHKVPHPEALRIGEMLDRLADIDLYTQMVLLPGRNDGDELTSTLEDLAGRPNVKAVAAVPVGLTAHRAHLPPLEPHTPEQAADVLRRVRAFQERMLAERGTRFVFASDEFYLRAGVLLPETDAYEGFPMLENGIGMVRDFLDEGLPALPERLDAPRRVLLATGRLFAPVLRTAVEALAGVEGLDLEVREVVNRTFGEVTTVAGLLAGRDLLAAVEPGEADLLLISPNMLKYGTESFLDDATLEEIQQRLAMPVRTGGTTLGRLARSVLQGPAERDLPTFGFSTHAIKEAARQH
jgi:putative radical SAM enzyme (TIGR03279 family)